ncbi:MAG: threonylcarbamoyl-AMP synthase [Chloroflexi bacterium]|nr:MAG: threonylcarbamoyl-AMP synthase [Chloroflexota bacterium]
MSERWPADDAHTDAAAVRLRRGAVIVFPTETVYGVGARASDEKAVRRLYAVKGRPAAQPLVLLVSSIAEVEALALCDDRAHRLMSRFWPGALTIVLPRRDAALTPAAAAGTTLAFRAPGHAVALRLLQALAEPVASSSANRAGAPPPLDADAAQAALGPDVDLVLDGGPVPIGRPSTIVDLSGAALRVLRPGSISEAELLRS